MEPETFTAVIAAASAVTSSIVTGVGTFFVAQRQFKQQKSFDFSRHQIELFERLHAALSALDTQAQQLQIAVHAKVTKNVFMTLESAGGHVSFAETERLVSFYAPELEAQLAEIKSAFDILFSAGHAANAAPINSANGADILKRCNWGRERIKGAIESSKAKIALMVSELVSRSRTSTTE